MSFSVIAALGNPGREYSATRHNAGWIVIDALASQAGAVWKEESRFSASVAKVTLGGSSVHLIKPLTFMNDSGRAVRATLDWFGLRADQILVIVDRLLDHAPASAG